MEPTVFDDDGFPVDFEQHLQDLLAEADASVAAANSHLPVDTYANVPVDASVNCAGDASANVPADAASNVRGNVSDCKFDAIAQLETRFCAPNPVGTQESHKTVVPVSGGLQFYQQPNLQEQAIAHLQAAQQQTPRAVRSRNESAGSIFDATTSPNIETPLTSPEAFSLAIKVPASTPSKKRKAGKKSTPRSKDSSVSNALSNHKVLNNVLLPRAIASAQQYSQHVSPFAAISPDRCTKAPQTTGQLDKARRRIRELAQERSNYQQALRNVTIIDPQTGKTNLQMLESQNANYRRVNSTQTTINKKLKEDLVNERDKYAQLAGRFNLLLRNLQQLQQENMELKAKLGST